MTKKDAIAKVRAGVTAGDLREILNKQTESRLGASRAKMSTINPALTRCDVWDILFASLADYRVDEIVDEAIAVNILREFESGER